MNRSGPSLQASGWGCWRVSGKGKGCVWKGVWSLLQNLITRGPTALLRAAPWRVCERERRRRRRRDPDPVERYILISSSTFVYIPATDKLFSRSELSRRLSQPPERRKTFGFFGQNAFTFWSTCSSPVVVSLTLLPCPYSCSPCSTCPCDRQCCLPVSPPANVGQNWDKSWLVERRLTAVTGTSSPTSPPPPLLLSSNPPRS